MLHEKKFFFKRQLFLFFYDSITKAKDFIFKLW